MKRTDHRKQLLAIIAISMVIGIASGSEIYRYTDANGEVHYGDRPTGAPDEEVMAIASRPSNPAQIQARSTRSNASNTLQPPVEETPPEKMTRAQRAEQARQTEVRCQQLRDQLESYTNAYRLYTEDDTGEREYLDDAQIDAARAKVSQQIAETCK